MKTRKPLKASSCKVCGSIWHTAMYHKPRKPIARSTKPIAQESPSTKRKRIKTANAWFKLNPPDETGHWECYLQISQLCPKILVRATIQLEHVKPKVRYPKLRFDVTNIKASCTFCNKLKGSRELEELARYWPHLTKYLGV